MNTRRDFLPLSFVEQWPALTLPVEHRDIAGVCREPRGSHPLEVILILIGLGPFRLDVSKSACVTAEIHRKAGLLGGDADQRFLCDRQLGWTPIRPRPIK